MKEALLEEFSELLLAECEDLPELMDGHESHLNSSSGNNLNSDASKPSSNTVYLNKSSRKRLRSENNEDGEGDASSKDENKDNGRRRKREERLPVTRVGA